MNIIQQARELYRILKTGEPGTGKISHHILRDIGVDPMHMTYRVGTPAPGADEKPRDPWCLAS